MTPHPRPVRGWWAWLPRIDFGPRSHPVDRRPRWGGKNEKTVFGGMRPYVPGLPGLGLQWKQEQFLPDRHRHFQWDTLSSHRWEWGILTILKNENEVNPSPWDLFPGAFHFLDWNLGKPSPLSKRVGNKIFLQDVKMMKIEASNAIIIPIFYGETPNEQDFDGISGSGTFFGGHCLGPGWESRGRERRGTRLSEWKGQRARKGKRQT
jgi:hypothetical protein